MNIQTHLVSPTKGEAYGVVYNWAIDITVPRNWTQRKDYHYQTHELGLESEDDLSDRIESEIDNYNGVLGFALCYLKQEPYAQYACSYVELPVRAKVKTLGRLFRQRSQDAGYLQRFKCDLRRFLDVEQICMPVVSRFWHDPKSVWLRQMAQVSDAICATTHDFGESMECEHDGCPQYVSVDRIDPPLPRPGA